MLKRNLLFLILTSLVAACAPDSRNEVSLVTTTYEPPAPTYTDEEGYKVVRGKTEIENVTVNYDNATQSMRLSGQFEFTPVGESKSRRIDLDLVGILDPYGFIALKPQRHTGEARTEEFKVAAKATCLSEAGSCASSFIDIYVYHNDMIYHHQVESYGDLKAEDTVQDPLDAEETEGEEGTEVEGGADVVEGTPGRYIGDVAEDIETILEIKKPEAPKKAEPTPEEPKAEAPKTEAPKAEAPKVEPPKKEEPVKEAPKKEDPKKEPPKKDEPKKDPKPEAPKKETPKPEAPKKEEPKKEEPKKEEPKKEEPVKPEPKTETPSPAKSKINKVSQAIGPVNHGRLENAMNMLSYEQSHAPAGFKIIRPQRKAYFSTNELGYIISVMGQYTKKALPEHNMTIGDLSREKGGALGSHKSHQNGLDADVALFFDNKTFLGHFASAVTIDKPHPNWMVEEQWGLYKEVVKTGLIDRIFIHRVLKKALCEQAIKSGELKQGQNSGLAHETLRRLIADTDHHNHFHLRVKCSKAQVRCRQMAEPVNTSGCQFK